MTTQVKRFRVAVYGVLIEQGKVLLATTRIPSGTVTNFPGGGLELGEAPVNAVVREFREETGLVVDVEQLLFTSEGFHQNPDYPDEQLIHIFYKVRRSGGALTPLGNNDDVQDVGFIDPSEFPQKRIFDVDREFLDSTVFKNLISSS
jgi:ADP-ribose pyrophosphatase YjhB (NUDIX family)